MARGFTQQQLSWINREETSVGRLIEIQFDAGTVRLNDYGRDIEWNGYTWRNRGYILAIGPVTEDTNLEIAPWTISLSGVDQIFVASVLQTTYQGRPAKMWVTVADRDLQIVGNPIEIASGKIDSWRVDDQPNGQTTVEISVAGPYGDIDGKNGRRTSDEVQRSLFPRDKFFNLVSQTPRRVVWGPRD